ncbi:unnamed protein product, partial [Brenthis ino]
MRRQRASEQLRSNQERQDAYVNQGRKPPRTFEVNSLVFVRKQAQSTGKLDSYAEDEESTTPSVTQPYNVDVPGDASEPQPSTSGTQIHGEEPAASPTFTSSDDSTEPSMPMLETDLQS